MKNNLNEIEEGIKFLKSKTTYTKNFFTATQIGAIISLYYIFSSANLTPFKQDIIKTFVPAIKTFN